jgi:hypothetical protein
MCRRQYRSQRIGAHQHHRHSCPAQGEQQPAHPALGTQLYGESPSLVAEQRLVWRVPVWLGLSPAGPLGQVGTLDVDTQTGEVVYTQQLLDELAERGDALAQRTTPG